MCASYRLDTWLLEEGVEATFGARVLRLHGNLTSEAQDEAIHGGGRPPLEAAGTAGTEGRRLGDPHGSGVMAAARRIVISTPIAESSLTIDGIGVVVDSGYRKSPIFNVRTGDGREG